MLQLVWELGRYAGTPCTYISDDVVIAAGFDPASREREDADDFATMLGCYFGSDTLDLSVTSLNSSYEAYKDRTVPSGRELAPINGRPAFVAPVSTDKHACHVVMKTNVGLVSVMTTVDVTYWDILDPCEGIEELASIIEPTIGAEN